MVIEKGYKTGSLFLNERALWRLELVYVEVEDFFFVYLSHWILY